jgi:uncharacterized protein (DUF58 family)
MPRDLLQHTYRRFYAYLTLDGAVRVAQSWAPVMGIVALLIAFVAPYRLLFFLAYGFLLLTLACYGWIRHLAPRIAVERRLRNEWAQVGDMLEEQWSLSNAARLPLLWLEIEDASTLPGYTGKRVVSAGAHATNEWVTHAICERRGVYTLGPLSLRFSDPLGLFRYEWRDESVRQIVIYPPLVQLPPLHIPQGQRGGLARADLLQQYATPSVGGLREYAPGDLLSHIHWPTVARTQRLMVKEFDQERAGALWIALDLSAGAYATTDDRRPTTDDRRPTTDDRRPTTDDRRPTTDDRRPTDQRQGEGERGRRNTHDATRTTRDDGPRTISGAAQSSLVEEEVGANVNRSPLELAIVLVCSLAAQALSEGRSVGLLANDGRQRLITPGRGPRQLWRILSELVDAQATGELPLGELLRQGQLARANELTGAALVVVTPALNGAWLPALATWLRGRPEGALALLIADHTERAAPLAMRLAAGAVVSHTFEIGMPLTLLNPPKPRTTLRVSPLGRVIEQG